MEISFYPTPDATEPVVIGGVYIELSEEEAAELASALRHMVRAPERGPDSHYHLMDTLGTEVTVWLSAGE